MPRWLYFLLILAVVAPGIELIGGSQQVTAIFIFSTLSLIPLAVLIGATTEDLAYYIGPIAGGLLNATFGNAPEIIIGVFALQAGLVSVVKATITGSIISNALLVLGGALALGGWRWGRQYFNARDAGQYSAMLVIALAGFLIPFIANAMLTGTTSGAHVQAINQTISIGLAIILIVIYALYLTLHIFRVRARRRNPRRLRYMTTAALTTTTDREDDENGYEKDVAAVSGIVPEPEIAAAPPPNLWFTLFLLLLATIGTAWNSELLVGTIVPVAKQLGWSTIFIGLVIIPIVGNAAEHSSALIVAYKDRVDLSMAIAAGSSIQVATFVAPVLVFASLFYTPHLDLVFQPLEIVLLGLATLLFKFISQDGESSWLGGVQLIAVYLMACIVFFVLPG